MRCHRICFTLLVIAFPLIFAAPCTAAKFGNLSNGQAETFVPFAEGNLPEGIAIHKDVMYVSNSYPTVDGLVSEVLRISPDGDVSVLTSFDATSNPDAFGRVGLAIGPGGDVLAAIQTLEPATQGVWRIDADGEKTRLPGSEQMFLPNAMTFDARGNLYVSQPKEVTSTDVTS